MFLNCKKPLTRMLACSLCIYFVNHINGKSCRQLDEKKTTNTWHSKFIYLLLNLILKICTITPSTVVKKEKSFEKFAVEKADFGVKMRLVVDGLGGDLL